MTQLVPSLTDLYVPIEDHLAVVQRLIDDELRSDLSFVNELCDTVRSYRGKMLRPALLLLVAKATGRLTAVHEALAAVVETVHIATLVHDDVLDEADERRRQPTVRTTAGNMTAILLGDYLISHAFHLCSGLDSQHASRRIGAATNAVCEGELLQNRARGNHRLTEKEYMDIIGYKTGALTSVSCELGAYYAGAGESVVDALRAYGMSIGIAFQIIDDVLDIVGNQEEVGKTLGLDLALGKLTLPVIHCLANSDPRTAGALLDVLAGRHSSVVQGVGRWLEESGSIQYAIGAAKGCVADAIRRLECIPSSDARRSLVGLAEFILSRRS